MQRARVRNIFVSSPLAARANYPQELASRRMVARRPSRLMQRFRAAARRLQAASHVGQAERRFDGRRESRLPAQRKDVTPSQARFPLTSV